MSSVKYYALRYDSHDVGCPVVLSGYFKCEEFEWDSFEPNPMEIVIEKTYSLELSGLEMALDDLDFDYYQLGDTYVSKKFLEACDKLGAKYRAVPLEISYEGAARKGDFFIFLPAESLAALDKSKSVFEVSKDMETGIEIDSPIYPGSTSIDNITSFVISPALASDVFRCQETLELFCSERFKIAATGLKGLAFEEIDERYAYDTWTEFNDI
ncbi:imm11 family protein [Pseudomonas sp. NBRC 111130]|uniref:imm11 family protein n=1 Tax=Pseudomonas sp. NBRC 111130 TaxID=1661045 RepID=UPI0006D4319A|nr:DUF1629 domain-containing protein [Pseudomonas sp. NBRC 111130]